MGGAAVTWNVDTRGADRDGPCVAAGVARKVAAATAARGSAKRRERDRGDAADAGERQRVACGARRETSGVKRQGARVHVRVGTWARARGRACVGIGAVGEGVANGPPFFISTDSSHRRGVLGGAGGSSAR